ncbi:MAG TPA: hypothetical protein VKQ30_23510 [Ktedonobacterales bacterium]|nr:hypothetical protein [Ktedonobacterales bacterium]
MGSRAQLALLPLGCAFILVGVLNHVAFHVNVPHFAIILGVVAAACIVVGGWASVQELRGAPSGAAKAPASPAVAAEAPIPAPVAASQDDATLQA